MPRPAVVLVLLIDRNDGEGHGMRKTRVFGQLMGVQGMVVGDVTMQPDPDGDGEVLVVSVRPDARSGGRCAQCRRSCPGYDAGVGTRRWRTVDTGTTRTFLESAAPRTPGTCAWYRCPPSATAWSRHQRHTPDTTAGTARTGQRTERRDEPTPPGSHRHRPDQPAPSPPR